MQNTKRVALKRPSAKKLIWLSIRNSCFCLKRICSQEKQPEKCFQITGHSFFLLPMNLQAPTIHCLPPDGRGWVSLASVQTVRDAEGGSEQFSGLTREMSTVPNQRLPLDVASVAAPSLHSGLASPSLPELCISSGTTFLLRLLHQE